MLTADDVARLQAFDATGASVRSVFLGLEQMPWVAR
jgi:hypothetical protein